MNRRELLFGTVAATVVALSLTNELPQWPDPHKAKNYYIWVDKDGHRQMGTLEEMRAAQERKDKP